MKHSFKIIVNSIATFIRIVINGVCTLVATRIALNVLGAADYGLYTLLAGTVAMMTFINTALAVSSQRYFSIAIGRKSDTTLNGYYTTSIIIHAMFGLLIFIVFISLKPIFFSGFLNISQDQVNIGSIIYNIMIATTVLTVSSIPFSALMNAYEDLTWLSLIDIMSCFIRLSAAIVLLYIESNHLVVYTSIMPLAILTKSLTEYFLCKVRYRKVKFGTEYLVKGKYFREMFGFISWNTLGALSSVAKGQGLSILLNTFYGTVINATYGIAHQINAIVTSFASALMMVFTPIITKAKGEGDEAKMRYLAIFSSKMAYYVSAIMALPILLHLDFILHFWLGYVPEHTNSYCFYTILCFLFGQIDSGINRSIYASGQIKGYQIWMSIIIVSILPIGYCLCKGGLGPVSVVQGLLGCQIMLMVATLYFANKHCNINVGYFVKNVVIKEVFLTGGVLVLSKIIGDTFHSNSFVWVITSTLFMEITFSVMFYFAVLNAKEKSTLNQIKIDLKNKLKLHKI